MNSLKKVLSVLLALMMILSLAACGKKEEAAPAPAAPAEDTNEAEEVVEDEPADFKIALVIGVGGLGDGSFNDTLKLGCDMAKEAYNLPDYQIIEPQEVAEFEGHFTDLSASGEYDLIVAGGFDAIEAMGKVAKEFPEQKYLFVDGEVPECDNVTSVTYRDNEKAYCLGIIAAMETETDKLGIITALDIDSLRVFSSGFIAGAQSVNPEIGISVKVVGGFADTTTAKELAIALKDEGCDILYVMAGGSGLGAFAAAEEQGDIKIIGCDTNQCLIGPDVCCISGMRLMQNTILNNVGFAMDGTIQAGHHSEGFAEDALDFTVEGSNIPVSDESLAVANDTRISIMAGEIEVPSTYEEIGFEF